MRKRSPERLSDLSNITQPVSGRAQLHWLEPSPVGARDAPDSPLLGPCVHAWVVPTCEWCGTAAVGGRLVSPVSSDTMSMSMSVSSLRPGQQVAAAHLCCARAGRQDLRLLTVPTEVLLPDRAAGECPCPLHTPLLVLFGAPTGTEGLGVNPRWWGLVLSPTLTEKATGPLHLCLGVWSQCLPSWLAGGKCGLLALLGQHSEQSRTEAAEPGTRARGF